MSTKALAFQGSGCLLLQTVFFSFLLSFCSLTLSLLLSTSIPLTRKCLLSFRKWSWVQFPLVFRDQYIYSHLIFFEDSYYDGQCPRLAVGTPKTPHRWVLSSSFCHTFVIRDQGLSLKNSFHAILEKCHSEANIMTDLFWKKEMKKEVWYWLGLWIRQCDDDIVDNMTCYLRVIVIVMNIS